MTNPYQDQQQPDPHTTERPSPYSHEQQPYPPAPQQQAQYGAPQYPAPTRASHDTAPPLWAPHYGISFRDAIVRFFKKYADFTGRAGRGEYWWWILAAVIVNVIVQTIMRTGISYDANGDQVDSPVAYVGGVILIVFFLGTLIPSIAVTVRRLHDANLSGWLALIGLVPVLGSLALLIMVLQRPNPAGQRFDLPTAPVPAYRA